MAKHRSPVEILAEKREQLAKAERRANESLLRDNPEYKAIMDRRNEKRVALRQLERGMDPSKDNSFQARIDKAEAKIQRLQAQIDTAETEIPALESEIEGLTEEMDSLAEDLLSEMGS